MTTESLKDSVLFSNSPLFFVIQIKPKPKRKIRNNLISDSNELAPNHLQFTMNDKNNAKNPSFQHSNIANTGIAETKEKSRNVTKNIQKYFSVSRASLCGRRKRKRNGRKIMNREQT